MVGKVGAKRSQGGRYRNYWCSRALKTKANCSYYNGHSAAKLETAILDYLSQFSDPELVKQHMDAAERKDLDRKQVELKDVTKGLADLEGQFLKHLDLLTKGILNEQEFAKANESIRSQKEALEESKLGLALWLNEQEGKVSSAEKMPAAIRSFVDDFANMEVRVAKAHLQEILKAAHVYRDDRIEIEFRV